MATRNTGSSGPIEKISDSVFRSKNETKNSGKESLKIIFEDLLQDTYNAEQQLIKALPAFAKASDNEELERLFNYQLSQTKKQSKSFDQLFNRLGIDKKNKTCKGMEGLINEAEEIIKKHAFGNSRDSALIIAVQKVQHYGIAAYGSLVELADVLCLDHIAAEFDRIVDEKKNIDSLLSDIAQEVNDKAYDGVPSEYDFYA